MCFNTTNTIIFSILSSSLFVAIVKIAYDMFSENKRYSREYIKQIVSIRLDAYSTAERIIFNLQTLDHESVKSNNHCFTAFCNFDLFYSLTESLTFASFKSHWLSVETLDQISRLKDLIVANGFNDCKDEAELKKLGQLYHIKISEIKEDIKNQLVNDFINLSSIKELNKLKSKKY